MSTYHPQKRWDRKLQKMPTFLHTAFTDYVGYV